MRTPGRCTNVEGCWIGSTQRNVWLSIGEDFACPNCGGILTPPPRHAISLRRLKNVAIAGAAVTVGVAAMATVGVKLSTFHWIPQPQVAANRHAASPMLAGLAPTTLSTAMQTVPDGRGVIAAAAPPNPAATRPVAIAMQAPPSQAAQSQAAQSQAAQSQAAQSRAAVPLAGLPPALLADTEDHTQPTFTEPQAPSQIAAPNQGMQAAKTPHGSDVVFADIADKPLSGTDGPAAAPRQILSEETVDEPVLASAAMVTMVSEAPFVLPNDDGRQLVLPVTFGKPLGPEDAAPPVSMQWRRHGVVRIRSSYFLPMSAEPDSLVKICRTPADLR